MPLCVQICRGASATVTVGLNTGCPPGRSPIFRCRGAETERPRGTEPRPPRRGKWGRGNKPIGYGVHLSARGTGRCSPISSSLLPVLAPDRIKSDLWAPATSILPEACLSKRIAATGPRWLEIGFVHCTNEGPLAGSPMLAPSCLSSPLICRALSWGGRH